MGLVSEGATGLREASAAMSTHAFLDPAVRRMRLRALRRDPSKAERMAATAARLRAIWGADLEPHKRAALLRWGKLGRPSDSKPA